MKEITTIFEHRINNFPSIDAITDPLHRAAAIADALEMVGCRGDQAEIDIYRAIQALRLEILDAIALLERWWRETEQDKYEQIARMCAIYHGEPGDRDNVVEIRKPE